jgi:hypothetical protein
MGATDFEDDAPFVDSKGRNTVKRSEDAMKKV